MDRLPLPAVSYSLLLKPPRGLRPAAPVTRSTPPARRENRTPPLALLARCRSGPPPPSPGSFSPPAAPASTSPAPSATGPRARPRLIRAAASGFTCDGYAFAPRDADVLDAWFPPARGVLATLHDDLPGLLRTSPPRPAPGSSKPSPPRAASPRPRPELPAKPFRLPVLSAASRALPPVAWPVGSFFASRRKWGAIKRRVRPPVSGLRD